MARFDPVTGLYRCPRCGKMKTREHFEVRKDRSRLHSRCHGCDRIVSQIWVEDYPDQARKARQRYYQKNREKFAEARREFLSTPIGKLVNRRNSVRTRLKKATDPVSIDHFTKRDLELTREIERLRAAKKLANRRSA